MIVIYGYIFYYFAALIGISIGYHRYFSHRSFKTSNYIEIIMLFFGLICGGRSAITWAAVHRLHHSTSDTPRDPHSPVYLGAKNVIFSQWKVTFIPKKYIKDLLKNPRIVFFHRYGKFILLTYAILMLTISIDIFLIFVAIPYALSWLSFGLLNYFAHRNGRPVNVVWLNFIAPCEGWHETHHNAPRKTRLHKFDIGGKIIDLLQIN